VEQAYTRGQGYALEMEVPRGGVVVQRERAALLGGNIRGRGDLTEWLLQHHPFPQRSLRGDLLEWMEAAAGAASSVVSSSVSIPWRRSNESVRPERRPRTASTRSRVFPFMRFYSRLFSVRLQRRDRNHQGAGLESPNGGGFLVLTRRTTGGYLALEANGACHIVSRSFICGFYEAVCSVCGVTCCFSSAKLYMCCFETAMYLA